LARIWHGVDRFQAWKQSRKTLLQKGAAHSGGAQPFSIVGQKFIALFNNLPTERQMTRKSPENSFNRVNGTQTARAA